MKRFLVCLCVTALCFGVAGTTSAYYFEDMIDTWWVFDSVYVPQYPGTLDYQHDINDDVNLAGGDYVTEAYLELDFTNDLTDGYHWGCLFSWDNREFAYVSFDENGWEYVDEVDNGQYHFTLVIDWLNDDGYLDVSLTVTNELGTADAWLDHSRLYGEAEESQAPVPEPGTMLLMGTGLVGLAGMGRKKFFGKK